MSRSRQESITSQVGQDRTRPMSEDIESVELPSPVGQRFTELTVLETRPIYPPQSLAFGGYEHEDFHLFRRNFRQFMMLAGVKEDTRRQIEILHAVLRGPALSFFEQKIFPRYQDMDDHRVQTLPEVMDLLEFEYITDHDLLRKKQVVNTMTQRANESPRQFLGRLREAADVANIAMNEDFIQARFIQGLLPEIRKHCLGSGRLDHVTMMMAADGYWFANRDQFEKNMLRPHHNTARELMVSQMDHLAGLYEDRIILSDKTSDEIDYLLQHGYTTKEAVQIVARSMANEEFKDMYMSSWPQPEHRPMQQGRQQNRYQQGRPQRQNYNNNYQGQPRQRPNNENWSAHNNERNNGPSYEERPRANPNWNNGPRGGNQGVPQEYRPLPKKALPGTPFYQSRKHEFGRNKSVPLDERFTRTRPNGTIEYDHQAAIEDSGRRLEQQTKNTRYWEPEQQWDDKYGGRFNEEPQQPPQQPAKNERGQL